MKNDFLLNNAFARELYAGVRGLPLIDWHNHLSVFDLRRNRLFSDITELWISSDPYKHRAMRICGVPERLITGLASSPREKFQAWSQTLPKLIGNPLYHWSMLELERVFGIAEELTPDTAESIWCQVNEMLSSPEYSSQSLLRRFKVEYAAPCVSFAEIPVLDFSFMKEIVPSFRGDDLVALQLLSMADFEKTFDMKIGDWNDFRNMVSLGIEKLHGMGCRFADHALDSGFVYLSDDGKTDIRFRHFLDGNLPENEHGLLASAVLRVLAGEYARHGWTMQLHVGALRHTSDRLRSLAGPAGGYAGIGAPCRVELLAAFLNDLENTAEGLPEVILYTMNPAELAEFAVLSGSFCEDHVPGKVQLGPAWWYGDHIYGMRQCLETIASYGVLSTFLGMTTDSRSLLSFVRHDYFRRVFCSWLAEKVECDGYSPEPDRLRELAVAVCHDNACRRIRRGIDL